MASYRPIDSKREEFRKYLERAGVMDALTRVLVSLYEEPEKPEDALEYVRVHLGSSAVDPQELENVKTELQAALDRIHALEEENASLKEKLGITSEAQPPEEALASTEEALESSEEVPASTEEAPASTEAEQEPTEEAPALPPEETTEEPPESAVEQVVEELPPEEPAQ